VSVFARFGYRKTSMDDVARSAGVSRQGLYLSFANKEELFRRAVEHSLNSQLASAIAALSRFNDVLETRLISACTEWSGRFVGSLGTDAADLMCASTSLAGATLREYEWQFEEALAAAIARSPGRKVCRSRVGHRRRCSRAARHRARTQAGLQDQRRFREGYDRCGSNDMQPLNPRP